MRLIGFVALAGLALVGCSAGPEYSAAPYSASPAATCSNTPGVIGGLAGAAGGALLGNQFGHGTGKDVATGAGALAGGAGGYSVGSSYSGC